MNQKFSLLAILYGLPTLCSNAWADIKMSPLFSDNMVLQRNFQVPIYGEADAGEAITVSVGGQSQKTVAGVDGKWLVKLAPLQAAEALQLTVSGKNTLTFKDVAVGEVWLASGQSNMELTLKEGLNAPQEIAASADPSLRMFTVVKAAAPEVQPQVKGTWQAASPAMSGRFSAVAYFFARELRKKLGVPVGIIHSSWGGTGAQSWTSRAALETNPEFQHELLAVGDKQRADYPAAVEKYNAEVLPAWQKAVDEAKAAGTPAPRRPAPPAGRPDDPLVPAALFNGMIAPLIPYGIQGVIWYQGESNNRNAKQYQTLFPTLIRDWRAHWNQGDFPFLYVQLAGYLEQQLQPSEGGWAELREAQFMALSLPKAGMASAIDLGESYNIHPLNKQEVGRRLSLTALATVYNQKIEFSGPIFESMSIEGNQIRLNFQHTGGGLVAVDNADRFANEPLLRTPPSSSYYVYFDVLQAAGLLEDSPVAYDSTKVLTRREAAQITAAMEAKLTDGAANAAINAAAVRPGTDIARLQRTLTGLKTAFAPQIAHLKTPQRGTLRGFALAGTDGKWVWADASIQNDSVLVSSPEVSKPVAVRYGWANNPVGNLYNRAGLPASSFRTDVTK
jgi:sialate O-acetylesterase